MTKNDFTELIYSFLNLFVVSVLAACQSETRLLASTPTDQPAAAEESVHESQSQSDAPSREPTATIVAAQDPMDPKATSDQFANADVLFVEARLAGDGTWTFSVTVEHEDTGWEDYADGWDVVLPDGRVLKPDPDSPFTRLLLHPHESEQPFTRSQSGILIPPDVDTVAVRAHDLVDGFGGKEVVVDLSIAGGQNFEVNR